MAAADDIPPVPQAPGGAGSVPPVEPNPATPAVTPPPATANPYAAPGSTPASPYAAPGSVPANPYAAPGQYPAAGGYQQGRPDPYAAMPQQPYPGYPGGYAAAPAKGLSLTSMILGIVSIFCFGFLAAIPAVILGHMAQRREPYARGMWMTGLITGYIGLGLSALVLLFYVAGAILSAPGFR